MRYLITYFQWSKKLAKCLELPDLLDLIAGLPASDIETLTIRAIQTHRRLMEKAERQFQDLPENFKSKDIQGGAQHLSYIEAEIEMFAQAAAVSTLVDVLGYVPEVLDELEQSGH